MLITAGHVPNTDLGPVISPEAKRRICELVESGVKEGAKLVLDGRSIVVPGFEKGNFVGPTVLTDVTVSMILLFVYLFNSHQIYDSVIIYAVILQREKFLLVSTINYCFFLIKL